MFSVRSKHNSHNERQLQQSPFHSDTQALNATYDGWGAQKTHLAYPGSVTDEKSGAITIWQQMSMLLGRVQYLQVARRDDIGGRETARYMQELFARLSSPS